MLPNKFAINGLVFSENNTTEVRLPKGMLLSELLLSGSYTDTIAGASATAAKTYGAPIKTISLVADGGKVLHTARPADLIREGQIYEQCFITDINAPPTVLTVGAQTGSFDIPLPFVEPFANQGYTTALPTFIYDELILRVEWGSHAQIYQPGASTGIVTIAATQSINVTGIAMQENFVPLGDPFVWGRKLSRSLRSFKEVALPGAAQTNFTIDLPRTADIRSLLITFEDANSQPSDALCNFVTLEVDNNLRQFNTMLYRALRSNNSKVFGMIGTGMPKGCCVLDFAEDRDITKILEATKMTALNLILDVPATAGTVRVFQKRIESPMLP
jgi:hypothetical protein